MLQFGFTLLVSIRFRDALPCVLEVLAKLVESNKCHMKDGIPERDLSAVLAVPVRWLRLHQLEHPSIEVRQRFLTVHHANVVGLVDEACLPLTQSGSPSTDFVGPGGNSGVP